MKKRKKSNEKIWPILQSQTTKNSNNGRIRPTLKNRKIEEQKITALLSELLQPKLLPAEFERRLRTQLKVEFQKKQVSRSEIPRIGEEKAINQVDMEKIQRIIGMAVTNEHFRRHLFEDAAGACRKAGFDLSKLELAALKNLKSDAVIKFAGELDERISKKAIFPSGW